MASSGSGTSSIGAMAEDAKPKPDAEARAARKRAARARRKRRGESAPTAAPAQAEDDATPLASRLQRIEDALTKQAELSEKLVVKLESLVAAGATAETDKGD